MEYIFSGLEEEALDISGDELRNNLKGEHMYIGLVFVYVQAHCIIHGLQAQVARQAYPI
jgi:hypothetical protein